MMSTGVSVNQNAAIYFGRDEGPNSYCRFGGSLRSAQLLVAARCSPQHIAVKLNDFGISKMQSSHW